ncbi:uncharacterized protein LOC143366632 [Andrena cerasifolii]|uniref:uncharacterized protein LOC143366632 n=1 Tax=Andrena cerasifolii TaxID=2819439 RepID=UPI0040380227
MSLEQLGKFERQNDISANVYTFEMEKGSTVFPLRLTSQKRDRHVNLFYTPNQEHGDVGHFVWIKNLSRLVYAQLSKKKAKKFICDRCMHYFGSVEKLEAHSLDCGKICEGNNLLKFSNHCRKERFPFVMYADLECIIDKTEDNHRMGEIDSKLRAYQQHKVHNIAYYMHCSYDTSLSTYRCRRDADCVSWFVNELENFANFAKPILASNVPMHDLTPEQWTTFRDATHCHICEEPFKAEDVRVRDHCHLSGRFRGPAHSECNLNYKNAFYIPIVFHNLSGYDSHFIIEEIATAFEGHVDVLPITKEKYISFTKNVEDTADSDSRICIKLRFIDSYNFLNTSLDKLASFLSTDKLKILRSEFETLSIEDFNLLARNGVFPYEYLDCANKLQDPCLPPRESFYSSLTGETVSETDIIEYRFDTSDYPIENAYNTPRLNKKVPGLMKVENNRVIMTEFVGLRAKMYALRVDGKKDTKKAKGVKTNVIARTITFDDYAQYLQKEIEMVCRQSCIRSKLHKVYTISESKIALSPYDDKRYIVPDSADTLPWGHYKIPLQNSIIKISL